MDLWAKGRDLLRARMEGAAFADLIDPLGLVAHVGDFFLFRASGACSAQDATLRRRLVEDSLSEIAGHRVRVEIAGTGADPTLFPSDSAPARNSPPAASLPPAPSRHALNPEATFSTFVVASSNQFAHAASVAVANLPGRSYNPLFIYGGSGLGKTHLLNAVGNFVLGRSPACSVLYLSSEQFTNELVHAIRDELLYEFHSRIRAVDVLLIDDIQSISGKEQTQEEFFHAFNALHQAHRQIVLTSDKPPRSIAHIEERLRSRFEWGLITDIQPPELETRIAILQRKADSMHIVVPDDVALLVATHVTSNIRELEGALLRLSAASVFYGKPISQQLVNEVLPELLRSPRGIYSIDLILRSVASHFGLRVADLKGEKRLKNVTVPRHIAMYLCRVLSPASFPDIGSAFGGKDHSTIIHAYKKIQERVDHDPDLRTAVQQIRSAIEESEPLET